MGGDICVFLSYASEDQSLAEKVKRRLEQEGWEIFFAHTDIKTGSFPSKIDQELKRATHFIPLLTNYSITKPWVTSEIDAALCLKNAGTLESVPIVIGLEVERIRPLLGSLNS